MRKVADMNSTTIFQPPAPYQTTPAQKQIPTSSQGQEWPTDQSIVKQRIDLFGFPRIDTQPCIPGVSFHDRAPQIKIVSNGYVGEMSVRDGVNASIVNAKIGTIDLFNAFREGNLSLTQ